MADFINNEREATHNGYSEKTIMINISLQEYRTLVEENAMQRILIERMDRDIEKAEAEAHKWCEKYMDISISLKKREEEK
jgi:hypothetical protein